MFVFFIYTYASKHIPVIGVVVVVGVAGKTKDVVYKNIPKQFLCVCVCDLRVETAETADWRVFDGGTRLILTGSDVDVFP